MFFSSDNKTFFHYLCSMFGASQQSLPVCFVMWKKAWTLKTLTFFKAFLMKMPSYCSWSTLCVLKVFNFALWPRLVSYRTIRRILLLNADEIFLRWPFEFLFLYSPETFKKFATAVLLRPVSPATTYWKTLFLKHNNFATFKDSHGFATQEILVEYVDCANTRTRMNTFCYAFTN